MAPTPIAVEERYCREEPKGEKNIRCQNITGKGNSTGTRTE